MKLSLAGWSLQRLFRSVDKPLQLVNFPAYTKEQFGIEAVELNSPFFASCDEAYLQQLSAAAAQAGVKLLNIAVDEKGDLSSDDEAVRQEGIVKYSRWVPVAAALGCSAIRANSGGKNMTDRGRAVKQCTDSFRRLAEEGRRHNVTILMENHWGLSADPESVVEVMEGVRQTHGPDAVGTLPDFGNWPEGVDRESALRRIMPYARAVHAKVLDIDENLDHPKFDLEQCISIAREAGYDGYLGIEYEGKGDPVEGVRRAVRKLRPML
jgi:sugar phosphate isomerase/epimerase